VNSYRNGVNSKGTVVVLGEMGLVEGSFYIELSKFLHLHHGLLIFNSNAQTISKKQRIFNAIIVLCYLYAFFVDAFLFIKDWHSIQTFRYIYQRTSMTFYTAMAFLGVVEGALKMKELQQLFHGAENFLGRRDYEISDCKQSRKAMELIITLCFLIAALHDEAITLSLCIESDQFSLTGSVAVAVYSVIRSLISPFTWIMAYNASIASIVQLEIVDAISENYMFQKNLKIFKVEFPYETNLFEVPSVSITIRELSDTNQRISVGSRAPLRLLSKEKGYSLAVGKFYCFQMTRAILAQLIFCPYVFLIDFTPKGLTKWITTVLSLFTVLMTVASTMIPIVIQFSATYKKHLLAVKLQKEYYSSPNKATRALLRRYSGSLKDFYITTPFVLFEWTPSIFLAIQDAEIISLTSFIPI
jgi:hypothetical protein